MTDMHKHLVFGLAAMMLFFRMSAANPQSQISNPQSFATFTDVAAQAGLTHASVYGDAEKKRYIIETNGCGTAFYDYDNDGWMDLLVLSGTRLEQDQANAPTNRLYKNNRNGTFTDVTAQAGLTRTGWASGLCIGDYDNDGFDGEHLVSQQPRQYVHRHRARKRRGL